MWSKYLEIKRDELIKAVVTHIIPNYARIISRYKEEAESITLLATPQNLINVLDDDVPADAIFEIWIPTDKLPKKENENEPRHLS